MMKHDEAHLLKLVSELCRTHYRDDNQPCAKESPRDIIPHSGIPPKRAIYILERWGAKGWYEYGVSIDLGWLTDAGLEAAHRLNG